MKKGKVLVLGALIALGLSSCIKDTEPYDGQGHLAAEAPIIEKYVEEHMPNAQYHEPTGIWYEVVSEGDGELFEYRNIFPIVHVNYTGELLDGREFDSDDSEEGVKMNLGGIIPAWQWVFLPTEVLYDPNGDKLDNPLEFDGIFANGLQKGSVVRFVTPSPWAYRDQSNGIIQPNSPLYFEVKLVDIEYPDTSAN